MGSYHSLCSRTPSRETLPTPPTGLMSQHWGLFVGGGLPSAQSLEVWMWLRDMGALEGWPHTLLPKQTWLRGGKAAEEHSLKGADPPPRPVRVLPSHCRLAWVRDLRSQLPAPSLPPAAWRSCVPLSFSPRFLEFTKLLPTPGPLCLLHHLSVR